MSQLRSYEKLPKWIETSQFITQFRLDYPDEVIQLNEELVFEFPEELSNDEEVLRMLESCRFFGINDWFIFRMMMSYFLESESIINKASNSFPEFETFWKSLGFIRKRWNNNQVDTEFCEDCARLGYIHALKYAHEKHCHWDEDTCAEAASGGHLDCLKYAHENHCRWNKWTCQNAAEGGHLDCLIYAHENGAVWDVATPFAASKGNQLECMKYAHENGCPWDVLTTTGAADSGYLKILKYAHENGCPWDATTAMLQLVVVILIV
eukprot:CAMPEP_0114339414 /NCGR_PEP_ID=MMETSP0101-20121206/7721_1 /TAXON_ID=38822 ORGANISM="Pteridomonas danica, Strain PT" /NCGR_SAMPLE_ID=MMETSP0101 /ASSEMBLY_ACC=CAM_ASM_000211 /LENGTH=264 /DNA_ID=CAMNT_0001472389 /DNA_START=21 /DNA_END=816 /DNA_ORIENTATION=-